MITAIVLAALMHDDISLAQPTGNEKIVAGRLRVVHEYVPVVRKRHRLIREQIRMIEVETPTTTTVLVPQQQTVMTRRWVVAPPSQPAPPPITELPPPAPAPAPPR